MNPYQNIDKKNGLKDDEKSPFYGCFSLYFDQVYPFREPSPYGGASIKVKEDFVEEAETVYDLLSGSSNSLDYPAIWVVQPLFHFYQQKDFKSNKFLPINCLNEEDYFFVLDQVSANICMSMENLYFALLELSSFLEDFQFFVYSADKKWLDEYKNQNGQLTCNQWLCDIEAYYGRLIYYINRTNKTPNKQFKLFTTWQLYNKLKNMVGWNTVLEAENNYKKNTKFIINCNKEVVLNNYFNDLSKIYQQIILKEKDHYGLIDSFKTWCLANQV